MKIRTYFILIVLLLSGGFLYNQMVKEEETTTFTKELSIPKQAIRLRILANSDQPKDQWLKRKVRDAIIQEIKNWKNKPHDIQGARELIQEKLPVFQRISEQTLAKYGHTEPVQIDFGQVPFPTKKYGDQIYPAGNYEALRITIGEGKGGNWWCVLFPPLCFIDMSHGDAVTESPQNQVLSASLSNSKSSDHQDSQAPPIQIRFFLLDKGMEWLENGF